ncbi:hypothetical protein NMA510612_2267 [Neisseria meningitidis]|uniref:Uncharacterized protein n=4 Tax=Neisseria meningitidis TaxID=487 RepID=X5FB93_NEIME|nr:hypothetical protein NMA510612_2267 [Neisseria meningitidis]CBA06220.1 hypothetical protein predicted by Glimmer/Critica [Neisseria meningitidis alpha275]CBA06546.1 hypothetical protein predicted by Glimmer/Critica [Neisseria meningitidis alpha153]CCA44056.1 hypothetical protein NMALPHA522_0515 [Neisseria meningitidis alpha522]
MIGGLVFVWLFLHRRLPLSATFKRTNMPSEGFRRHISR